MNKYTRTDEPYSLDEVLFIMNKLVETKSEYIVADLVLRSPESIKYKFLEYRKIVDKEIIAHRSFRTQKEADAYEESDMCQVVRVINVA